MRKSHAESFGNDLGGGGSAEKLTATTWGGTGSAGHLRGFIKRHFATGVAGGDTLYFPGIFSVFGEQGDAAGDENAGEVAQRGKGHHCSGETFVAGGDTHDGFAGG